MSKSMSFAAAAFQVLSEAEGPLHYSEITKRALSTGYVTSAGKTPAATLNAVIAVDLKQKGEDSPFIRVSPGCFGVRGRDTTEGPPATGPAADIPRVKVPLFPRYDAVRAVLPVWSGRMRGSITGVRTALKPYRGDPKSNADWSAPLSWIPLMLEGALQDTAVAVWNETSGLVNPSDMRGHWLLASNYGLVEDGPEGGLVVTKRGTDFIENPSGPVVREIDETEGVTAVLSLIAEQGPAKRAALLPGWIDHLQRHSRVRGEAAVKSYLGYRMANLRVRGLIERGGLAWSATSAGLGYLRSAGWSGDVSIDEEEADLLVLLAEQKTQIREQMRELLHAMDPFAFEHLVKDLLVSMEYEDVEVTKASNDKGVDVVGRIELGISSVREVIQVKRLKSNVLRPTLDGLRGSLHRFQAVRGTIITTGGFSKGAHKAAFEVGAAPITLIDGEKLVSLLAENGIGVVKQKVEFWKLDEDAFAAKPDETDETDD